MKNINNLIASRVVEKYNCKDQLYFKMHFNVHSFLPFFFFFFFCTHFKVLLPQA